MFVKKRMRIVSQLRNVVLKSVLEMGRNGGGNYLYQVSFHTPTVIFSVHDSLAFRN